MKAALLWGFSEQAPDQNRYLLTVDLRNPYRRVSLHIQKLKCNMSACFDTLIKALRALLRGLSAFDKSPWSEEETVFR